MLREFDSGKVVNATVPQDFRLMFGRIKNRMAPPDYSAAEVAIDNLINNSSGKILAASWMPGNDWRGTAFQPIYTAACAELNAPDAQHGFSARFFGQMVRQRFVAHPDRWLRFYSEGLANSYVYIRDTV